MSTTNGSSVGLGYYLRSEDHKIPSCTGCSVYGKEIFKLVRKTKTLRVSASPQAIDQLVAIVGGLPPEGKDLRLQLSAIYPWTYLPDIAHIVQLDVKDKEPAYKQFHRRVYVSPEVAARFRRWYDTTDGVMIPVDERRPPIDYSRFLDTTNPNHISPREIAGHFVYKLSGDSESVVRIEPTHHTLFERVRSLFRA